MQTNLRTDDTCFYNESAAPFFITFQPGQYENTFPTGEIGIYPNGGGPGCYVRPDAIDVSSFLSGRDDILTKCIPPTPSLDELNQPPLIKQNQDEVSILIPKFTKEKRSAVDLSSINYDRWQPFLPANPQNLRYIIEDFAPTRGGMNTTLYAKSVWNPSVKRGLVRDGPKNLCEFDISPARANPFSNSVSGYSDNINGRLLFNKPPGENQYPFQGPTSQDLYKAGMINSCGVNMFSGENYDQGSCMPPAEQRVLKDNPNNFMYI
jgi:hypothetical protein